MKKKVLTLAEELNEIKRVMKKLLNEDNIPINQRKDIINVDHRYWNIYRDKSDNNNSGNFYGEPDTYDFLGEYSSPYGELFGVLVTTKKNGVDYMNLDLGFEISISNYQPSSRSRDYNQPDDPEEFDVDFILVQGSSTLISDENGETNKLSEEELEIIKKDEGLMSSIRSMDEVNELVSKKVDDGNGEEDPDKYDDDY